ncbi:MAG: response regulator transcription factor [Natronospirillum sp.]|uniref:response regulator n=1 Tax=Natronospirillum sp. TaxID=2812955 RepID=UPI0025D53B70|nr:response regulator transcription factor [Natronospirillum sp.]MCH8551481.1 response regulator transcription factor [Natronospirillum sp.]
MDTNNPATHVLVVDDDLEITQLLNAYLTRNQFRVSVAHNGTQMMSRLDHHDVDLIVLDIMMPGDDGFTLCQKLRTRSDIPIIMLTAGSDETDRIIGLELGADDYMTKPFNPRELLARIKAVLRRVEDRKQHGFNRAEQLKFGVWTLDVQQRQLHHERGDRLSLNGADYDLLQIFLQHPGEVISRESLFQRLKGRELSPYDRSIDVQISRLRHKLNDDGKSPQLIKTVRGQGYLLTADVEVL